MHGEKRQGKGDQLGPINRQPNNTRAEPTETHSIRQPGCTDKEAAHEKGEKEEKNKENVAQWRGGSEHEQLVCGRKKERKREWDDIALRYRGEFTPDQEGKMERGTLMHADVAGAATVVTVTERERGTATARLDDERHHGSRARGRE